MSETSYEQCRTSYRGYVNGEIDTAHETLRKYGKPCSDAVKELRLKTNMPMSECGIMLHCLWRDVELERIQSENEKLRKLATYAYEAGYRDGSTHYELEHCPACKNVADLQAALDKNAKLRELLRDLYVDMWSSGEWLEPYEQRMRELEVEVDRG